MLRYRALHDSFMGDAGEASEARLVAAADNLRRCRDLLN
jgi:hypothetical protein